jgi:hypothetical protein
MEWCGEMTICRGSTRTSSSGARVSYDMWTNKCVNLNHVNTSARDSTCNCCVTIDKLSARDRCVALQNADQVCTSNQSLSGMYHNKRATNKQTNTYNNSHWANGSNTHPRTHLASIHFEINFDRNFFFYVLRKDYRPALEGRALPPRLVDLTRW